MRDQKAGDMGECKGELLIVGLGLDSRMITLEALDAISSADSVFLETYTSPGAEEMVRFVEKLRLRSEVRKLTRRDIEELGARELIDRVLGGERVALLVYGDPLVATTHNALRLDVIKLGCRARYIPGISVYHYAVSFTGLFNYKFGPSVTVVYPRWGIKFTSPYQIINENLERGLHSFVFLDIDEKMGPMTPDVAVKLLLEASLSFEKRNLSESSVIIILERMGTHQERVYCMLPEEVISNEWKSPPYSLIIPSKLHFIEEDVLANLGQGCAERLGGLK